MRQVRRSEERGHFNHGWLDTYHTFSFGDYNDPRHRGFHSLRVINEDRVAPSQGFGMHGHRNMEILTFLMAGTLAHRDSLGHESQLHPGEVQRMTAGSGIQHSEFNPSGSEPVHLYQIWLRPEQPDLPPSYEQKEFAPESRDGRWQLLASRTGRENSLVIQQSADLWAARLKPGVLLTHSFDARRSGWLQVVSGMVKVDETTLSAGDGLSLEGETDLTLVADQPAEVLLFDLA